MAVVQIVRAIYPFAWAKLKFQVALIVAVPKDIHVGIRLVPMTAKKNVTGRVLKHQNVVAVVRKVLLV
jgi:hypothetical protein